MKWIAALLVLLLALPASGVTCTKGCRCGNTCISCAETCHKDDGGGADPVVIGLIVGGIALGLGVGIWLAVRQSDNATAPARFGVSPAGAVLEFDF